MSNFKKLNLEETTILFSDYIIDSVFCDTTNKSIVNFVNDLKSLARLKKIQISDETESLFLWFRSFLIEEELKLNA